MDFFLKVVGLTALEIVLVWLIGFHSAHASVGGYVFLAIINSMIVAGLKL